MKAAICTRYGPPEVLQIRDVPDPVPGAKDVLIRIHAAAATPSDCYIRSGLPAAPLISRLSIRIGFGFGRPRRPILGAVLVGEVEAAGAGVRRFHAGDRVWAFTLLRMGAYAQRIVLPERFKLLAPAPSNLAYEEAAAIPYGGLIALYFLRKANIQRGQRVLIYGASGANGTAALQFARHRGARVTAACGPANIELCRSLGAGTVLDYTKDAGPALPRYDLVFDAVGRRKTSALKDAAKNALTLGGRYMSVDDSLPRTTRDNLVGLARLAEAGVLKPVIDTVYPLSRIADAHSHVEAGHKKGNVIIATGG